MIKRTIVITGVFYRKILRDKIKELQFKGNHIEVFNPNWLKNSSNGDFEQLKYKINSYKDKVTIIGLSSGGLYALVLKNIYKNSVNIITVCTPINKKYFLHKIACKMSKSFSNLLNILPAKPKYNYKNYISSLDAIVPRFTTDKMNRIVINKYGHFRTINYYCTSLLEKDII